MKRPMIMPLPILTIIILLTTGVFGAFRNGDSTDDSKSRMPSMLGSTSSDLVIEDPISIVTIADTIASNAEIAALQNDFTRAHMLFVIALELITTLGQDEAFDTLTVDDTVFNRIAEYYVDLLPSNYLDSVPSAISSYVARYQLNDMMNNMDSTLLESSKYPFACGEGAIYNVPITYNRRVQQAIRALTNPQREHTMNRLMTRTHFYRPFMAEMFAKAGLPTDLTYLPLLESAFNPKAYSPAHASGLWQFIPSTGKMYNMRDNYWVDERRDPIKATAAAIGYFTRLYRMFGDWHLALASYNTGEGRVGRIMSKTGAKSYWQLTLSKETMNYVPLFIAYQVIGKNPHCFGYKIDTTVVPFNYDTVKVSDCIDLQKIASAVGITYDSLKSINPHIKHWCTPPNMSDVNLYLPNGTAGKYKSFYAALTDKEKIIWHRYMVKYGDSLDKIAERFNVSEQTLRSSNKMTGSTLAVGRYIVIPIPASGGIIDSAYQIEKITENSMIGQLQEPVQYTTSKKTVTKTVKKIHTVKKGETLSSIARKYDVTVKDLAQWNKIASTSKIGTGRQIKIFRLEKTTITVRTKVPSTGTVPSTSKSKKDTLSYIVQENDTVTDIAEKLHINLNELVEWNNLNSTTPKVTTGQKLIYLVPAKSQPKSEPQSQSTVKSETVQAPTIKGSGEKSYYTVSAGETLFSISQKIGVTLAELCEWNDKDKENPVLHAGEKLVYFGTGTTAVKSETEPVKSETIKKEPAKTETIKKEPVKIQEPKQEPKQTTPQKQKQFHTVSTGETMSSIAELLGCSIKELCAWNDRSVETATVFKDEKLVYYGEKRSVATTTVTKEQQKPVAQKKSYTVKAGESMASVAQKLGVSTADLCKWNNRSVKKPIVYKGEKLTYFSETEEKVSPKTAPKSESKSETKSSYVVLSGETMSIVASKLGVSVEDLAKWNDKSGSNPTIYRGEKLVYYNSSKSIPSETKKSTTSNYTVKKGDTMYSISRDKGISVAKLRELNNMDSDRPLREGESLVISGKTVAKKAVTTKTKKHTVKQGESLWSIANKFGVSLESLCETNGLKKSANIQPGKVLKIPSGE